MDLLNKFKNFWGKLNLIVKILIIFILFGLVISSFNLSGYIVNIMIIVISGLGLFTGIKGRKKTQIIISGFVAVFVTMGLYFDIEDEKEYKRLEQAEAKVEVKEQDNKVEDKKDIKMNEDKTTNVEGNNSIEVKRENLTESEKKLLKTFELPDEIKKVLNEKCKYKDEIVDVQYVDLSENDGEKILTIHGHIKSNFTNEMMLKQGFIIAKDVIKSVRPSYSTDIDRYNFWFTGDVIDGNGKSNQMKILQFEYQTKIFEGADLDLITTKEFIDYAENVWTLPGKIRF